jgi:hypothetical protein
MKLIQCREHLCDTAYDNIVWCHSENNAPHHLKDVSFVKGAPGFDNPKNVPTLIVLDDLMDSAYSKKSANYLLKDRTTVTLVWC